MRNGERLTNRRRFRAGIPLAVGLMVLFPLAALVAIPTSPAVQVAGAATGQTGSRNGTVAPRLPASATASANSPTADCSSSWSITRPADASGAYTGVSAVTDQDVWSVGYKVIGQASAPSAVEPLAAEWNGSKAVVADTPKLDSQHAEFNGVSMTSADNGWAAGFARTPGKNSNSYDTLVEQWNGTAWTTETTPNPTPGGVNLLVGVDALSASDAWAVGSSAPVTEAPRSPLAETWNGSNWTVEPTVSVGTEGTALLGVSGDAPNDVWAVGYAWTSTYQDVPVIEHWNGTSWILATNDPSGTNAVLTAVSASGPNDAWAVGYTDNFQPYAEHWNGTTWSETTDPALESVQLLRGVVDLSPTDVWAVGTAYVAGTTNAYEGVAAQWNGSQWTTAFLPAPAGDPNRIGQGLQARGIASVPGTGQLWMAGGIPSQVLETLCDPTGAPSGPSSFGGTAALPAAARGSIAAASPPRRSSPRSVVRTKATSGEPVVAVDEAAAAGIAQNTTGWTASVNDFNGDGLPDIFLMRGAQPASLYLNTGKGTFEEIDQGEFPAADRWDCVSGTIQTDQNPAIYCAIGADHGNGLKASELYVQGSDTTYSNQASAYGLLDPTGRGRIATFIHVGKNKLPDLFVGQDPFRSDGLPHPDRLYVNTGHGFVDDPQAGLDQPLGSTCAVPGDYLNTGYDDLLLCTPTGTEHLYQDNDGTFTDVTAASGLPAERTVDAAWADLNGDGLLDLVLATPTDLLVFLQQADHTFKESFSMKLKDVTGVATGDVNRDGSQDIYVVTGGSGGSNEPDLMLLNNGSGTSFTPLSIPEATTGTGDNAYPIDYERNGLTDFLVLNGIGEHVGGPLQLITFFPAHVPGAPVIGTATAGNAQATVTFSPPTTSGGSTPSSFTVVAHDATNNARGGELATGASGPLTVTGLTNGDSYTFTVTATNAAGTGPASAASNAVVPTA